MESIENIFFQADKAIDEGDIEKARELLLQILSEDPKYGQAHNHLGWLYKTKFLDPEKAEKHYRLAIKFSPGHPAAYLNYINLLRDLGRLEELEELLQKAETVRLIGKSTLYDELGSLSELKGDYRQAIEYYKKAISYSLNNNNIEDLKFHIRRCRNKLDYFHSNRFRKAWRALRNKEDE